MLFFLKVLCKANKGMEMATAVLIQAVISKRGTRITDS